jgi:hypothetical protein
MSTHINSRAAFAEGQAEGDMGRRALACYQAVCEMRSATDRMVRDQLRMADMNMVRPRLTELVHAGWLVECGDVEDTTTHKMVRVLRPTTTAERAARLAAAELQTEFTKFL